MARRALLVLLFLAAASPSLAGAGACPEHVWPDEALLRDRTRPAYVLVVRSVEEREATNGAPPRARVEVVEALRGDLAAGRVVDSAWLPMPHDIDTTGREAELEAWSKTPLAAPRVGTKWIVLCLPRGGPTEALSISSRCREAFSDEARARVRAEVEAGERDHRERERVRAAERARLERDRKADAEAQALADVRALCAAADEVWIARCDATGFGGDLRHRTLALASAKRLDRAAGTEPVDAGAVFVLAPADVDRLLALRGRNEEYVFFVRRGPTRRGGGASPSAERELLDLPAGFLLATAERVEKIRATLAGGRKR